MTQALSDENRFKADLVSLIPQMRAYARSLCRGYAEAEDLAQDAVEKAWKARGSFQMGTNIKAWTFMILRNQFLSEKRRSWRSQPLDQDVAERTLVAKNNPDATFELEDLRRAMAMLPEEQREALILVGAGGLPYEEAAQIVGVAVGTIKSRVSRARAMLVKLVDDQEFKDEMAVPSAAMASIFSQFAAYRSGARGAV